MIVRVAHREHFTVIRNKTIRDSRLSWKATGLLVYLLSFPDDMRLDRDELAAAGPDGVRAVRSALQELRAAGYLCQVRKQDEHGRWRTEATLYEVPRTSTDGAKRATDGALTDGGKRATKGRSTKEKGPHSSGSARAPMPLDQILRQCARRIPDAD